MMRLHGEWPEDCPAIWVVPTVALKVLRSAVLLLTACLASQAFAAEWKAEDSVDPFDDHPIRAAVLTTNEMEIRVTCKGKSTFRVRFRADHLMDVDQQAFGSNHTANAMLEPQINAKLRFDAGKARNLSFFATDDWKGFWTGQGQAARIVRSMIVAERLVMMIYGLAGDNRVVEIDLPRNGQNVKDVMAACRQKVEGRSLL